MMDDREEVERAKAFIVRVADERQPWRIHARTSTESGKGRKKFLAVEKGQVAVGAMRTIKAALDLWHIMNSGKIL
jgi:D-lactate dehydrogenase (cytochrome)